MCIRRKFWHHGTILLIYSKIHIEKNLERSPINFFSFSEAKIKLSDRVSSENFFHFGFFILGKKAEEKLVR